MQIRYKGTVPAVMGWTNPKKRFFFNDNSWHEVSKDNLNVLQKKKKNSFKKFFDLRETPETKTFEVTDKPKKKYRR